ncbi:hypothetical protein BGZ50_007208 [Haplosporangium sp. Z 11]|nr:hypothetical protein BGZ50_007208 [Haplosporangium sp. Z 11]
MQGIACISTETTVAAAAVSLQDQYGCGVGLGSNNNNNANINTENRNDSNRSDDGLDYAHTSQQCSHRDKDENPTMRWDGSARHEKGLGLKHELGHNSVYRDVCINHNIFSLSPFRKILRPLAKIETLNQKLREKQDPKGNKDKGDKTDVGNDGGDDDDHNDNELDRADAIFFGEQDPEQDDDDEENEEEREQERKVGDHGAMGTNDNVTEDTTEAMKGLDDKKDKKGIKKHRRKKDFDEAEDDSQDKDDDYEDGQDMEDVENDSNDQESDDTDIKAESASDNHDGRNTTEKTATKGKSMEKEKKSNERMELEAIDRMNLESAIARTHSPVFSKLRSKLVRQQQEEEAQLLRDIEMAGLGSANVLGVVDHSSTSASITETADYVPEEDMQVALEAASAKLTAQEGTEDGHEPAATTAAKTPLMPQQIADTEHQGTNAFFKLLATDILEATVVESRQSSEEEESNYEEAGKKAKKLAKGKEKQEQNGKKTQKQKDKKAQKKKDKTSIKKDGRGKKKSSKDKHRKRQIIIPLPVIAHEHIPLKAPIFTPEKALVEKGIPAGPFLVYPTKNNAKGDFGRDARTEKATADQRKKKMEQDMVEATEAALKAIFGGSLRKTVEKPSITRYPKVDEDAAKKKKQGVLGVGEAKPPHSKQDNRDSEKALDADSDYKEAASADSMVKAKENKNTHRVNENVLGTNDKLDDGHQDKFDDEHQDTLDNRNQGKLDDGHQNKLNDGHQDKLDDEHQDKPDNGNQDKLDDGHQNKLNDGHQDRNDDRHKTYHKVESAKANNTTDEVDKYSPIFQEQPQQPQSQSQPHHPHDKGNIPIKIAPIIPVVGDSPVDRKTPEAEDKKDEQTTDYGTVPMFGPAQLDFGSGTSAVVLQTYRAIMLLTAAVAALNTL